MKQKKDSTSMTLTVDGFTATFKEREQIALVNHLHRRVLDTTNLLRSFIALTRVVNTITGWAK